jgi:hypothetical protein
MHVMTNLSFQVPFPRERVLLHEPSHRINNELCSARDRAGEHHLLRLHSIALNGSQSLRQLSQISDLRSC